MGSTQSTSEENYNNNNNNSNIITTSTTTEEASTVTLARTSSTFNTNLIENSDPWWPIENNINFTLEQPNLNEIINDISNNLNNNSLNNNNNNGNINRINNINNFNNINCDNNNLNQIKSSETEQKLLLFENIPNNNNKNNNNTIIKSSTSVINDNDCNIVESVNLNKLNKKIDKEQTLEEFKEELKLKRMARQTAISELRDEIQRLRSQLNDEREINKKLRNGEKIINIKEMIDVSCSTNDDDYNNNDNNNIYNINAITIENNQFEQSLKDMVKQLQKDLAETHYNLQMTNSENISLNDEVGVLKKQVNSLKDVVSCSKQMIDVREEQVTQLKTKLTQIEESLADRETKLLSEELRREYDKQMQNIRNLRQLYEERARVCAAERENLLRQIQIKKDELAAEIEKAKNLEERISTLENDVLVNQTKIEEKNSECNSLKYENREFKEEMNAINMLFSQMLMGFNGNNCLDIDRLTLMLEENRTLLNEMAIKEANYEGASLPKLLFDIVKQANNDDDDDDDIDEVKSIEISSTSIELPLSSLNNVQNTNIIEKETALLPKVIESTSSTVDVKQENITESLVVEPKTTITSNNTEELLDQNKKIEQENISALDTDEVKINLTNVELQQKNSNLQGTSTSKFNVYDTNIVGGKVVSAQEIIGNLPKVWRVITELLSHQKIEKVDFIENGQSEECYKTIQTGSGIKPELSVSKTYIKLKNLILEKKSLVKETTRLKTLNSHLEYRLNEQEKRLSTVSLELQKTWHLVGRMQRQHRQLHTHEQILRYQLQQKRRLLGELKEELEYCRRKWAAAKAKNIDSQLQCDDMRKEFAKRRLEDSNNSAESGYSDGAGSGTDEEVERNSMNANREIKKIPPHKFVHDFIDNARSLQRRNSLSPSRNFMETNLNRCQSAPAVDTPVSFLDQQLNNALNFDLEMSEQIDENQINLEPTASSSAGAVPKQSMVNITNSIENENIDPQYSGRTERIQRLEQQCKSLIARVLETSGSREKLELQIKRFQDEMPPAQHPIQNDINPGKRKSISPEKSQETTTQTELDGRGKLTEREEEYTRRRAERIQRLENESKQLMSKIRKTNDRGSTMVTRLKELHARCISSREGSIESSSDEAEKSSAIIQENVKEEKPTRETSSPSSSSSLSTPTTKALPSKPETTSTLASVPSSLSSVPSSLSSVPSSLSTTTLPSIPSTSTLPSASSSSRLKIDIENDPSMKMLGKCAERLKRLEEESQMLLAKWTKNSERGSQLENKLDNIHSRYGQNSTTTNNSANKTVNGDDSVESSSPTVPLSRSDSQKTVEERLKEVEIKANSRNERLKQMERDSKELISKLTKTSDRGSSMIDRLAENRERRNSLRQEKLRREKENGIGSCSDDESKDEITPPAETAELLTVHKRIGTTPKVKTLPKTGVAAITLSRHNTKLKDQKSADKKASSVGSSETLEEMFMRLSGLSTPGSSSSTSTSNDKDDSNSRQTEKTDKDDSQPKEKEYK